MGKQAFNYVWSDRKRVLFGLPWSFTTYFLTDTKFITRTGLFTISEDEFDLYKVADKKLVLPFWQRLFGCGTIQISVRGDVDTPMKEVKFIKHPRDVLAILDQQIDGQRDRYNTRGRDLYGAGHIGGHPHHNAPYDDDCDCGPDCDCRD